MIFVRPPGEEGEDCQLDDPRWGPLDDEDISRLLRRIDFQKIIDFHTKDLKHKFQKSESTTKKQKEIITSLQGEISVLQGELKTTKITCEQQQVQIDQLHKRLEGLDGERLEIIEHKIEELQVEEVKDGERLDNLETQLEELKVVSENENSFQEQQHQDFSRGAFDSVKNNIIIKNLPMVSPNEDLDTLVKDVFKHIGLSPTVNFSASRIMSTKKAAKRGRGGRKGWPPVTKVVFRSQDTKGELFPLLHKLKGSTFSSLSVQNEWPCIYRHQIKDLEIKAAAHRREFPGSSTRIKVIDGRPTIMVRKSASCSFQPL